MPKATGAGGIYQAHGLDGTLALQVPGIYHPRLPWILASEANLHAVLNESWEMAFVDLGFRELVLVGCWLTD